MLFSIIIPAFNAEKYLCDSLESVRAQTFTDYEIIIVNDGSTDKTRQIADSFAEKNSQTHVIHQKNEGLLLARRVGLQAASGKYAVFLDADDALCSTALRDIADVIHKYNVDIVSFRYSRQDNFLTSDSPSPLAVGLYDGNRFEEARLHFCKGRFNEMWGKAIKLSCFDRDADYSSYARLMHGEDLLQLLPVFDSAHSLYSLDKVLYFYRPNDSASTARYKSSQLSDIRKVNARLLSFAMQWGNACYQTACHGEVMQYINLLKIAVSYLSYASFGDVFRSIRKVMDDEGCLARAQQCQLRIDNSIIVFCLMHNFCYLAFLVLKIINCIKG